ncbi:N-terminal nucleophile aminohydrolase [Massarina eburnea CBS 473.64]|uniref:N-terminal nucleophile aminohydrolase n=1 Tax=Massarina eburnea CBS 473.64 TaxID=1395130 RepID=A0A6A6S0C2_9PLEO|nr:N-terminal nucleophile aminohydrolase [Massarina eburnea CBS 473.64]
MTNDKMSPRHKTMPRIIIHGGAGNITRQSMTKERYDAYHTSLLQILNLSSEYLSKPGTTALDAATYAVSLLENDTLYNSGKGAVFSREGKNELECSIMVSNGYRKRGVGCTMLQHVKNPVKLARELLLKGETDGGDGSQDHCQYSGGFVEGLAEKWGLEMVEPDYFFTQQRWDEHRRGLDEEKRTESGEMSDWERTNYIPLGTCGAVVLDGFGTVCAATSTGGLTNKVPGRVGDTPTIGAGFWAEEWYEASPDLESKMRYQSTPQTPLDRLSRGDLGSLLGDCLPLGSPSSSKRIDAKASPVRHAVAMSGTGNGDTFLRLAAASTTANKSRFASTSLANAISWMAGRGGELQKSAGDRWGHSHEGTGGMIGIELIGNTGTVVFDYNCGGMFRAWTEEDGEQKCLIFREDRYESGASGWSK